MKALYFAASLVFAGQAPGAADQTTPPPWSGSEGVIPPPYDLSELKEETLFDMLRTTDDGIRISVFDALRERWKSRANELADGKRKKGKEKTVQEEPSANVQKLLDILHDNSKKDDALSVPDVLAFTPPEEAHHTLIEKHLRKTIAESTSEFVRMYAAEALVDSFWVRGEAPDEESVKALNKLLQDEKNVDARFHLLHCMSFMGSDAAPYKETLKKIAAGGQAKTAEPAKLAIDGMKSKMDAKKRQERVFLPTVN